MPGLAASIILAGSGPQYTSLPPVDLAADIAACACSEKDAAQMVRTMLKVVAHCHSLGVIHRCACTATGKKRKNK